MNKEELKNITDEVIDSITKKLKEQVEETENKQQELTKKEALEQAVERFNENERQFIATEAFKIFHRAKDEKIALEALRLIKEVVQSF